MVKLLRSDRMQKPFPFIFGLRLLSAVPLYSNSQNKSMLSKKEVKYIQTLKDKKNRDAEGVFIAEGPKLVNELLAAGMKAKTIYSTEKGAKTNVDAEIKNIDEAELQRISHFEKAF